MAITGTGRYRQTADTGIRVPKTERKSGMETFISTAPGLPVVAVRLLGLLNTLPIARYALRVSIIHCSTALVILSALPSVSQKAQHNSLSCCRPSLPLSVLSVLRLRHFMACKAGQHCVLCHVPMSSGSIFHLYLTCSADTIP